MPRPARARAAGVRLSGPVLVTGGTGYVAGWCIVELLRRGRTVRATIRSRAREGAVRSAVERGGVATDGLTTVEAELLDDRGWAEAMDGCEHVLHVASPMGPSRGTPDAFIGPARDGTLRVLRVARHAGVKRVVMTSSLAACMPADPDGSADEDVWTDPDRTDIDDYRRSKTLAERAAWDFVAEGGPALVTLLPGAIFGPPLAPKADGSVEAIDRLVRRRVPGVPRIVLSITDVRDLAEAHGRALDVPEAAGQRFIVIGERLWMADIARVLHDAVDPRVPTRVLPDALFRFAGWFVPSLRQLSPLLGRSMSYSSERARRVLGWSPRPAHDTLVDTARRLLER